MKVTYLFNNDAKFGAITVALDSGNLGAVW